MRGVTAGARSCCRPLSLVPLDAVLVSFAFSIPSASPIEYRNAICINAFA